MKTAERGFSLIELMTAILVLGVLLAMAVPSFREMTRNNRVAGTQNDLLTSLAIARSEALHRSQPVTVCASSDSATCIGGSAPVDWTAGWIVFTDAATVGSVDAGDEILQVYSVPTSETRLTGSAAFVRYGITGMLTTAATQNIDVYAYGCTGAKKKRVTITAVGSPSLTKEACS